MKKFLKVVSFVLGITILGCGIGYCSSSVTVCEQYNFYGDASRGELREEYFGIKLADLEKNSNGEYVMTDEQRKVFIDNILGVHKCSLQWISWERFGECKFFLAGNKLMCKGGQRIGNEYLIIDGQIEVISPLHLRFVGTIRSRTNADDVKKETVRKGVYNFKVRGQRGYWRMQEIVNPLQGHADYIDIYFF
ncbi:MAG: hypothetical protein IJX65_03000 [Alistipes sp.]|nr:hypothetical protein [Alistipes sp.]